MVTLHPVQVRGILPADGLMERLQRMIATSSLKNLDIGLIERDSAALRHIPDVAEIEAFMPAKGREASSL